MERACMRFGALTAVAIAALSCSLVFAVTACGDDDQPSKSRSKDAGSEKDADVPGMRIPTGGRSGAGDMGDGANANLAAYTCQPKRGDTGGPTESGGNCCGGTGTCQGAGDNTSGLPHETCKAQPDLRCVPKPRTGDDDAGMSTAPATCRVQLPGAPAGVPSYEGRCLANCYVQASPIAGRLSQATCNERESCAPCYNPLNGRTTGICELPGDSPLDPPPVPFKECGDSGLGYCVPAYAAGNAAGQLGQLTCATGELCAPKNKVADPGACFEHCETALGPGACAPNFLAGALSSVLMMSTCSSGELCIPCDAFDTRTGVCD
jgi:hypothetical protein